MTAAASTAAERPGHAGDDAVAADRPVALD